MTAVAAALETATEVLEQPLTVADAPPLEMPPRRCGRRCSISTPSSGAIRCCATRCRRPLSLIF
ncbi:hypothetical protein ACQPTN_17745 [Bradyrhizobium sp. 13971]